jgi:hypothetical protein
MWFGQPPGFDVECVQCFAWSASGGGGEDTASEEGGVGGAGAAAAPVTAIDRCAYRRDTDATATFETPEGARPVCAPPTGAFDTPPLIIPTPAPSPPHPSPPYPAASSSPSSGIAGWWGWGCYPGFSKTLLLKIFLYRDIRIYTLILVAKRPYPQPFACFQTIHSVFSKMLSACCVAPLRRGDEAPKPCRACRAAAGRPCSCSAAGRLPRRARTSTRISWRWEARRASDLTCAFILLRFVRFRSMSRILQPYQCPTVSQNVKKDKGKKVITAPPLVTPTVTSQLEQWELYYLLG